MRYYSIQDSSVHPLSFKEATLAGQSQEGGLFFPTSLPKWDATFMKNDRRHTTHEVGYRIMKPYVGNDMGENELRSIIEETFNFEIPLQRITNTIYALELFHGPTMAFKDVGARFLSRCLSHFSQEEGEKTIVLVATSGDTGGAVASSFEGIDGVEVVILYPSGKVSPLQEKQLCSLYKNIHTLEIDGNFDQCQKMVKGALQNRMLQKKMTLTSANSINIARWLPQQIYYVLAYKMWLEKGNTMPPTFSVPSGNFGNICAGIVAHLSGMPVSRFLAACNANDIIPRYLSNGGNYEIKPAIATISNAMDIGEPNNFSRIQELLNYQYATLQKLIYSVSVSDATTMDTIKKIHTAYNYILDPHTAVGYQALEKYLEKSKEKGIVIATAHPIKFADIVEKIIDKRLDRDEKVNRIMDKTKNTILMPAESNIFCEWLCNAF